MSGQPQSVTPAAEAAVASAFPIPTDVAQAQEAFRRDLPRLRKERPGQWVAYRGQDPILFGRTKTAAYQECLRQGVPRGAFVVRLIQADPGDGDILGPLDLG